MPGEADRLKKENEELRREVSLLDSDNANLERMLKEANKKLEKVWDEKVLGQPPKEDPLRYCDNLSARLDELAQRMDKVAAAYDSWDLMRDQTGTLHSLKERVKWLEKRENDLTLELGRLLMEERRRWWQR